MDLKTSTSPSLEHRRLWQQKPVLRIVYEDLFRRLREQCVPGSVLEIGGGSGNFKDSDPDTLSLDIQPLPWVDAVADAYDLPFAEGSFDNIVLLDTLHHLERPGLFFRDAARVLRPGGRLIMIDPMISPLSHFFYHYFHPEPVDMDADPLGDGQRDPDRDPFASNQAIPTLLFFKARARFENAFPEFKLLECRGFALFAYPLSGGFRPWSLLPAFSAPALLWLEKGIEGLLAPLMGFRMIVVIEKI